ncbi:hypothetical protein BH23GEM11_BH23GEM11_09530 [soil metagenome]
MPLGRLGRRLLPGVIAACLAVYATSVEAQARPDGSRQILEATEAALADGRYAEARARIETWWEAGEAGRDRSDIQRAIWLRARLTVDPQAAELFYRRLVVEFPGGDWSDQSLLRLSHGAQARGEVDVARRYLEILIRDYPGSPHRVEARSGLARLAGGQPSARDAGGGSQQAQAPTPPAAIPPAPTQPAPPPPQSPRSQDSGAYAVQFGAFGQVSSARSLAEELGRAGLNVRLVRVEGSPLIRVRLGRFSSREEAESRVRELRERGFEVLTSVDGDLEETVPAPADRY